MARKGRKVILILVEGGSDLISLELIKKLNRHQEETAFKITKGDLTLLKDIKEKATLITGVNFKKALLEELG